MAAVRESINLDAERTVREEIRNQILKAEIANRKAQLLEKIKAEYREQIRTKEVIKYLLSYVEETSN